MGDCVIYTCLKFMYNKAMNIEKFWSKVDKATNLNGCWEWTGLQHPFGYGRFAKKLTHRISFELFNHPLKASDCILHQCDNPKCVNPAHLKIGTRAENARERTDRGRTLKGIAVPTSKLSEQDVLEIRLSKKSVRELANIYGVGESNIYAVRSKTNWSWL